MKKLLLTMSTISLIASPLITVVACGEATDGTVGGVNDYLQIGGEDFIPEEDGMYLMADHYDGHMFKYNFDTHEDELYDGEILEIYERFQFYEPGGNHNGWHNPYIEFGKHDSFVVVYNEDDEDGYSTSNFEETFAFNVNLLDYSEDYYNQTLTYHNMQKYNNKQGYASDYNSGDPKTLFVGWSDGKLNDFVGANRHIEGTTAIESLPAIKETHDKDDYEAILDALFLEELEEGVYTDSEFYNDELTSHRTLREDAVLGVPTPLFEYEQIAKNAIKITNVTNNQRRRDEFHLTTNSFGFIEQIEDSIDGREMYVSDSKGWFNNDEYYWGDYHVQDSYRGYIGVKMHFDLSQ